jgi:hypothetical protein
MEVNKDTTKATTSGTAGKTSTPETGKYILCRNSLRTLVSRKLSISQVCTKNPLQSTFEKGGGYASPLS